MKRLQTVLEKLLVQGEALLNVYRLCLSAFLSTLESTIISTSLVSITDSFEGFNRSSWIVTSYLLTYTGQS